MKFEESQPPVVKLLQILETKSRMQCDNDQGKYEKQYKSMN